MSLTTPHRWLGATPSLLRRPGSIVPLVVSLVGMVCAVVLLGASTSVYPRELAGSARPALLMLASVSVIGAGLLLALAARCTGDPSRWWLAVAATVWGVQELPAAIAASSGLVTDSSPPVQHAGLHLLVWITVAAPLVCAMRGLAAPRRAPWLVGSVVGAMLAGLRVLLESQGAVVSSARMTWVVLVALLAVELVAVVGVVAVPGVSRRLRQALGIALALLAGADALDVVAATGRADLPSAPLAAAGGVLLLLTAVRFVMALLRSFDRRSQRDSDRAALAELELRESRERLHEVGATLAGVAAATRILGDGSVSDARRRRLQSLLDGELARLERLAKGRDRAEGRCDVDKVVTQLANLFAVRGITVTWAPSGLVADVHADALTEILHVLLCNSERHTAVSSVAVEVDAPSDEMVRIVVRDHGPGVPAELRSALFDFGRRGAGSPGQGIGLHAARQRARQLGGELSLLDDPVGRSDGAAFEVRLPRGGDHRVARPRVARRRGATTASAQRVDAGPTR